MQLRILGTAAAEGIPGIFCRCELCKKARALSGKNLRTRSGAMIDGRVLIDFSADSYHHALRDGLDLAAADALLVTHAHADHLYPADIAMREPGFAHLYDAPEKLAVYGPDIVGEWLRPYVSAPESRATYTQTRAFEAFMLPSGHEVLPLLALHNRAMTCLFYRVRKNGRAMLYGHDTGLFPEATMQALAGEPLHVVTLDCTFCGQSDGANHMGFPDCLTMRERLREAGCVTEETRFIITHFSHNGGMTHEELCVMAHPHGFEVAYDGMVVEV